MSTKNTLDRVLSITTISGLVRVLTPVNTDNMASSVLIDRTSEQAIGGESWPIVYVCLLSVGKHETTRKSMFE